CAWVACGRPAAPARPQLVLAVPAVLAIAIATGFPMLSVAWADRFQAHPAFAIDTFAAYDVRAARVIVNDPHPEIVEVSGVSYEIDRSDALHFDADDIGAIARDGDTIVLHVTNSAKARALAHRSMQRMSMLDALYIDGRRVAFPVYRAILLRGHVALSLGTEA